MFVPIHDVPVAVVSDEHPPAFLALLPRLESKGRLAFASIRCHHDRADAVAEVVALGWEQFRRMLTAESFSADDFAAEIIADVRTQWGGDAVSRRRFRTGSKPGNAHWFR